MHLYWPQQAPASPPMPQADTGEAPTPPTTVLVTGAAGFAAGHIIEELLHHGYAVRGTIRETTPEGRTAHLRTIAARHPGRLHLVHAQLDSDKGWADAVAGCAYVIHVASPSSAGAAQEELCVIRTAVEGTLRVLQAAAHSGTVCRVVTTSCSAAAAAGHVRSANSPCTEKDWALIEGRSTFEKSKTLAEQAAWQFIHTLPEGHRMEMVTLNPGHILGPLQNPYVNASMRTVQRLLDGSMRAVPNLSFNVTDVRDLAVAHRLALEKRVASGNRYLCAGPATWLPDMAELLAAHFGPQGARVPLRRRSNLSMWLLSRSDPTLRPVLPDLGRQVHLSSQKATAELGLHLRPIASTLHDSAQSLIDHDVIHAEQQKSRAKRACD
ncbi:NAD-dependent epimerase/dehydratase family protein [Kineosporia sp. NBRC 101677]|uniref:NAD-dependent epimerase/dehydratase family protein n=1 Tax=Kineosporia sp. NBRC 101677 TaxID=3032197 RepID=UPI002554A26D|nr:NAD-dependent epimerase/dehydratase family protein [Kineosporia sp. NBRC 101677]